MKFYFICVYKNSRTVLLHALMRLLDPRVEESRNRVFAMSPNTKLNEIEFYESPPPPIFRIVVQQLVSRKKFREIIYQFRQITLYRPVLCRLRCT
jgi:hypothetical protein